MSKETHLKKAENKGLQGMIDREVELVEAGKEPFLLIRCLEEAQLDPTMPTLTTEHMQLLISAYIVGRKFSRIEPFVRRNAAAKITEADSLIQISRLGVEGMFQQLGQKVAMLISKKKLVFSHLFEKAVKQHTLESLSKVFKNFPVSQLKNLGIDEGFLKDNEYQVNNGFIEFVDKKQTAQLQELLQERMKQITKITDKVISYEK